MNTDYVECQDKYNTSNNRGKEKYLEIFQKMCKQHKLNQGTKETRHIVQLHTYCGEYRCCGTLYPTYEITLHVV
jgi:hypothetical protein